MYRDEACLMIVCMSLGLPSFPWDHRPLATLILLTLLLIVETLPAIFNVLVAFLWIMIATQLNSKRSSSLLPRKEDDASQGKHSVYHTAKSEFIEVSLTRDRGGSKSTSLQILPLGDPHYQVVTQMMQDLPPHSIFNHCAWRVTERDYLRFARARNGRVNDALKLMKEHVEFRRVHGPIEHMRPHVHFPHALASKAWKFAGVTRCRHPFAVFKAKNVVPKDIQGGITEYVKYLAYNLDSLGKTADSIPESDGKLVVLIDLEGWSMSRNVDMSFARQFVRLAQDEFPERLHAGILVNSPFVFTAFWRVLKPWLDSQTREKIDILGSNFHDTLVSRFLDKEQLEAVYGGTHRPYPDTVEHTLSFL